MIDSSGNTYREVDIESESLRITLVPNGWNDTPAIRLQAKDEKGHLRRGPEIPMQVLSEVIAGMVSLAIESDGQATR